MKELIERLRATYHGNYEYETCHKAADALERLTAENAALKEGLDGWHARFLDMEIERDAALAASRHETDMCQQALEDLEKMRGESGVLRELLAESLSVIKTIDGADECECDLLESMCDKIKAAITPQAETGDLL